MKSKRRRTIGQFIARPLNFHGNPKVEKFCRRVKNPLGVEYIMRWHDLIVSFGTADGRVRDFDADDIASYVGFTGNPRVLITAMKDLKELGRHRGVFFHPRWNETITGHYALKKVEERDRSEKRRSGQTDESVRSDHDSTAVGPRSDRGVSDINKETGGSARPLAPPRGGGNWSKTTQKRWAWLLENHPTPQNPEVCKRYLEALGKDEWAHAQWALGEVRRPGTLYIGKKNTLRRAPSDVFLRKQLWLGIRRPNSEKPATNGVETQDPKKQAEHASAEAKKAAKDAAERHHAVVRFLLAKLEDPEVRDAEKDKIRIQLDELKAATPTAEPAEPAEAVN